LESDPNVQAKNQIVKKLTKHKRTYKSAVFRGAVTRRNDIPEVRDKWLLYVGIIKLEENRPSFQFRQHIIRDNFLLFETTIKVSTLIESLEEFCREDKFNLGKLIIEFPRERPILSYNSLYDSERSKKEFNLEWATDVWQIDSRTGWGISGNQLELVSEDRPFRDLADAIQHYVGLSRAGYSAYNTSYFNNKITIMFPHYYARIKNCILSERALKVAIESKRSKLSDLTIKYNCSTSNGKYLADTVPLKENSIMIEFPYSVESADVWLYHREGFTVDFRNNIFRILNSEEIVKYLSNPEGKYYPESILDLSIAQTIRSYSEDFGRDLGLTTEELIDTIDQEILKSIKIRGKSYKEFASPIIQWLPSDEFLKHLGKLHALNHLYITDENKIALTAEGIGLTLLPPSTLVPRVPRDVAMRIAEIRLAFLDGDFDKVINAANILFEYVLRNVLKDKFGEDLEKKWGSLEMKPLDRATLGDLKTACIKSGIFSENSVEAKLLEIFSQLRVPISHQRKKKIDLTSSAKMTLDLAEMFVRYWYYQT
jgi:hypothetical protein